jgi:hypothetical protein
MLISKLGRRVATAALLVTASVAAGGLSVAASGAAPVTVVAKDFQIESVPFSTDDFQIDSVSVPVEPPVTTADFAIE